MPNVSRSNYCVYKVLWFSVLWIIGLWFIVSYCRGCLCCDSLGCDSLRCGSLCRGSLCFGSLCRGLLCRGPLCRGSLCRGSLCRVSLCCGSLCRGALCCGSLCRGCTSQTLLGRRSRENSEFPSLPPSLFASLLSFALSRKIQITICYRKDSSRFKIRRMGKIHLELVTFEEFATTTVRQKLLLSRDTFSCLFLFF